MGGKISYHQNCVEFKQMGVALGPMALSQRSVSSCQSPRPWGWGLGLWKAGGASARWRGLGRVVLGVTFRTHTRKEG